MKRIITGIFAILIIMACLVAAIPFLVSSETVRNGITFRIEELTGRKVTFQGDPSLSFSPFLGFEISDLELVDPSRNEGDTPLLKVEKVKAQLNLLPALIGKIEITDYHFLRPRFLLKTYSDGIENWSFTDGGFRKTIQAATNNRANQVTNTLDEISVGDLVIKNGILVYEDEIAGTSETITSINGKFSWPDTNSEIDISGNGIWRGEGVTINSIIENPVEILSGGESPVFVELNSQPLTFNFNGQANMLANLFVKGAFTAQTPSINRLAEIMETDIGGFTNFGQWSATGEIEATADNASLSEATFTIGNSKATGVIKISKNEVGQSKLDGTLAFETIDLASYLISTELANAKRTQPNLIDDLNVDLRISSQSINLGMIALDRVAAAIIIDNEGWTFDIGDASAFNGKLTAKLGERLKGDKQQAFLDISASQMDAGSITNLIDKKLIGINGKTSFVASIRTNNLKDGLLNSGLNGSFTGNFNSGEIIGVDLPSLLKKKADEPGVQIKGFDEDAITSFQKMKIKLFLNNGIAAVSKSIIQTVDNLKVQVIGDVNLHEGKLDLQLQELTENGPKENRLFIEGTTLEPLITLKSGPTHINQD